MINAAPIRLLLILGLLFTTACNNWKAADSFQDPVFSSDGNAIAGVHAFYEAKCNVWSSCIVTYNRNHSYHVWAQPMPDFEAYTSFVPSASSQRFDGKVESVVYVQNENHRYVLVTSVDENSYLDTWSSTAPPDEAPVYTIRQFQIGTDGQSVTSSRVVFSGDIRRYENCGDDDSRSSALPLHVYASRDGANIAMVQDNISCAGTGFELKILRADTLDVVAQQSWEDLPSDREFVSARNWQNGWTDLPSSIDEEDVSAALAQRIQSERGLYNSQITEPGYAAWASDYVDTDDLLATDNSPRQIFILNANFGFGSGDVSQAFQLQDDTLTAVDFDIDSTGMVDRGALMNQLRQAELSGAFLKDRMLAGPRWQRERGASNNKIYLNRDFEITGYYSMADEPAVNLEVSRAWSIDRSQVARQNREVGLHSKTFWIRNGDSNNRVLRGELQCLNTIELDENGGVIESTSCTDWPDNYEDLSVDADWPYTDLEWDGLRWAELHWAFDGEGAVRICEVQALNEAGLDTLVINRTDFNLGCDGQPWKTITNQSFDLPMPMEP